MEHPISHRALTVAVYACMFVFGIVLLLMGSVLPKLPVTRTQAGDLGSLPLLGILVGTILVGPTLDRWGAKPALAAGLGLIAGSLFFMGAVSGFPEFAAAAFVYGVGGGFLNTGTNAFISDLDATRRGAALNLLGFFFSLGALFGPLLMFLLGRHSSPSVLLPLLGGASALVLVLISLLRFPPPTQPATRLGQLLGVLRHPAVWLFGILLLLESANENCMFVWSGKTMVDAFQTSAQFASLALISLNAAMGAGRLLAVRVLRWLGGRRLIWLSTGTVIAGALVSLNSNGAVMLIVGVGIVGLGLSSVFPTALALAGDRFSGQSGTVFGAVMTVALIGGTAGPRVAASLAGLGPLEVFWIPVCAAAGIALLTFAVRPMPKRAS